MNYFSPVFGLVTKNDPQTENGGLFLAHYLVLCSMLSLEPDPIARQVYIEKMTKARISSGLYLRSSYHTGRTVSQDEQTGFSVGSYLLNLPHRFDIWDYLVENKGIYPATGVAKFYNPGSYYSWAVLADYKLSALLAPFYTLNLLITSVKDRLDTSSKLIYLTELYVMKEKSSYSNLLWKYFSWKMKRMYGEDWITELYAIYFSMEDSDHPLIELSRKLKLDKSRVS